MLLPDFTYHSVRDLSEALALLTRYGAGARIIAGGTDLLLQMKRGNLRGKPCPEHLISLKQVTPLSELACREREIIIGANVTHRQAELAGTVQHELGALSDAVRRLASVQVRNVATIAGNLCNAAPCADTAAPLIALSTQLEIAGPGGERTLALEDFFAGPGQVRLADDEILCVLRVPRPQRNSASAYERVCRRDAMDITIVGAAAWLRCGADRKTVEEARIALNTVAPTPVRAAEAEAALIGRSAGEPAFRAAGVVAAENASPRTSHRSTAEYRREMVKVVVRRALARAFERIGGGKTSAG